MKIIKKHTSKCLIALAAVAVAVTAVGQNYKEADPDARFIGVIDVDAEEVVKKRPDYLLNNPRCLTKEIIYDGCTMMLNSDGEYIFGQFNVLHPELQMRILMQGITFYIDPTGRKKEKYALTFPAASAVESTMSHMSPPQPSDNSEMDNLPDIRPLITSLATLGAEYDENGIRREIDKSWTSISMDDSTHCLSYTFLLPVEKMLEEKKLSDNWTLTLYSEGGGRPGMGGPGMGGPGMGGPGMGGPGMGGRGMGGRGMGGPGMGGAKRNRNMEKNRLETDEKGNNKSKVDLRKIMMNDIKVCVPFSFSGICAISEN